MASKTLQGQTFVDELFNQIVIIAPLSDKYDVRLIDSPRPDPAL